MKILQEKKRQELFEKLNKKVNAKTSTTKTKPQSEKSSSKGTISKSKEIIL